MYVNIQLLKYPRPDRVNGFDLIDSKNWDLLVKSMKVVTQHANKNIGVLSLVPKLRHSLQHMARVGRSMSLKEGNRDLVQKCSNLISLYQTEWQTYAMRSQVQFDDKRKQEPH